MCGGLCASGGVAPPSLPHAITEMNPDEHRALCRQALLLMMTHNNDDDVDEDDDDISADG